MMRTSQTGAGPDGGSGPPKEAAAKKEAKDTASFAITLSDDQPGTPATCAGGACRDQFRPPKAQISSRIGIGTPKNHSSA
jgi:hypothetical protein